MQSPTFLSVFKANYPSTKLKQTNVLLKRTWLQPSKPLHLIISKWPTATMTTMILKVRPRPRPQPHPLPPVWKYPPPDSPVLKIQPQDMVLDIRNLTWLERLDVSAAHHPYIVPSNIIFLLVIINPFLTTDP